MSRTTALRTLALASLAAIVACQDAPPTAPASPTEPAAARSPVAKRRMIEALFQKASPEVLLLPGAVFADHDERIGKLVVGVERASAGRNVRSALARLGATETDYVVEVTPPIHRMATLRDRFDPTRGGIQVHFGQYVCTMGFNIDGGSKSGRPYGRSFITNSHCTDAQGGTEGTVYYQPLSGASGIIGTEADDPTYFRGGVCPRGRRCRYSDAARVEYASGTASSRGEIARTIGANTQSLEVDAGNPFFTIVAQNTGATPAAVGEQVSKVGRTTGWTRGTVTRTCVNTAVSGSQLVQLCQTWVSNPDATIVAGGDSGSPVFVEGSNGVTLVGILWGGSSDNRTFIFSPLGQVQQELGTFSAVK